MKIRNTIKGGYCGKELLVLAALGAAAASAWADWDPGDPYKMHFPQLPNPTGWDVNFTQPVTVADDWQCSETGPITDIHFWFSVRSDEAPVPPTISSVNLAIYDDVPDPDGSGPLFSHPSDLPIKQWTLTPSAFSIRLNGSGDQGWYDPSTVPATIVAHDHINIWQLNISSLSDPIIQNAGTIYWLGLSLSSTEPIEVGWKTSLQTWNDDAVWGPSLTGPWGELTDPYEPESLNMSFVITTPEPQTYGLVIGTGLMGFAVWRNWRKRG